MIQTNTKVAYRFEKSEAVVKGNYQGLAQPN